MPVVNDTFARNPDGRIDLRTWPHRCQIFLNRASAEDLIKALQACLAVSVPPTSYCIELAKTHGGTSLAISSDDADATRN